MGTVCFEDVSDQFLSLQSIQSHIYSLKIHFLPRSKHRVSVAEPVSIWGGGAIMALERVLRSA